MLHISNIMLEKNKNLLFISNNELDINNKDMEEKI